MKKKTGRPAMHQFKKKHSNVIKLFLENCEIKCF